MRFKKYWTAFYDQPFLSFGSFSKINSAVFWAKKIHRTKMSLNKFCHKTKASKQNVQKNTVFSAMSKQHLFNKSYHCLLKTSKYKYCPKFWTYPR